MAVAIPAAIAAAGAIGSGIAAKKSASSLSKTTALSPEDKKAQAGGFSTAGTLGNIGASLYGRGAGTLDRPQSYYETLLGRGGRSAMEAAVAPQAENIASTYGGLAKSLEGSYVRGGVRDVALAEANREKAGQISRLTAGVQPAAAGALTDIGKYQVGTGVGATGASGGLYADLLGQGTQNRALNLQSKLAGEQIKGSTGQDIGSLLFQVLSNSGGKGGGSKSIGYRGLPVGG